MKKHAIIVQCIYYVFKWLFVFSACSSVSAQSSTENRKLTTEQEVIDRYQKVTNREKYPDESYFSLQKNIVGENTSETDSEIFVSNFKYIEFIDFEDETIATISASMNDENNSVTRFLDTKEKRYMFMEDGTVTENPSLISPDVFERFPFKKDSTSTEKLSLPNEIFDSEEVYVIHNVIQVDTIEQNFGEGDLRMTTSGESYRYFSINTGFLIGIKIIFFTLSESSVLTYGITTTTIISSKSISHIYLKDYRLVGNVLFPHKEITIMNDNSEEQTITSSEHIEDVVTSIQKKSERKISANIKYNVDIEHFKSAVFKHPEKAIEEIPNEF